MRQVVLDGETIDVTDNMLLACIVDIRAGMVRMPLECKHTAAIASLLQNREAYLDSPPLDWNWKLSDNGRKLEVELQARKADNSNKIRCPLCESGSQTTKRQYVYGTVNAGNINGMNPGQVVLISLQTQGGRHGQDS